MPLNRRKFISTTAAAGGAMIAPFTPRSLDKPSFTIPQDFTLKLMATNWGFPGTVDEFCAKAKKEGYDGIEMWWPANKEQQDMLFSAIQKHNLEIGFLCGAGDSDFENHLRQFRSQIDAVTSQQIQRPLYINCHSGRDYFSFDQNRQFISYTIEAGKKSGNL